MGAFWCWCSRAVSVMAFSGAGGGCGDGAGDGAGVLLSWCYLDLFGGSVAVFLVVVFLFHPVAIKLFMKLSPGVFF